MKPVLAAVALLFCLPSAADAQAAELGLGRRLGRPLRRAPPPEVDEDAPVPDRDAWLGPQIHLGYSYWKLSDGYGGGDVHAASVEAFIQWPVPELRTGIIGEVGGHDYSLAGDDLSIRGALELGIQLTELIDPVLPHFSVIVSVGALVGERFETTVAYAYAGGGVELGAALRVVRNLHLNAALSYLRLEMDGAAFDVFMFRAGVGL